MRNSGLEDGLEALSEDVRLDQGAVDGRKAEADEALDEADRLDQRLAWNVRRAKIVERR